MNDVMVTIEQEYHKEFYEATINIRQTHEEQEYISEYFEAEMKEVRFRKIKSIIEIMDDPQKMMELIALVEQET